MKEYQTFTYIMYQESMEREKREEEEKRRADEQRKTAEKERKQQEIESKSPQTRAEMLMQARRNANMANMEISRPEEIVDTPSSNLGTSATLEDLVEYLEDEM